MGRGSAILLTRKGHAVSSIVVLVGAVTVMGDEGAGRMISVKIASLPFNTGRPPLAIRSFVPRWR